MNILLIHSDQHRYDCIAAHGQRKIITPHLDLLARKGTSFSRAYSTIPICTPARASLLTGAWPTTHGSFSIPTSELNRPARSELPTIFQLLKRSGYRTAWVGKYHNELECDEPSLADGVDEFVPLWHYNKFCEDNQIPQCSGNHGLFGDVNTTQAAGQTSLAWQADQAIRLLDEANTTLGSDGQSFFVRWDIPEPHIPCRPAAHFADLYDPDDIPPWPSFPDSLEGKPGILQRQRNIWGTNGWNWEQWAPLVRLYYGAITEMDHHIGRVLDHLEAIGRTKDTLVIYSTDHGDFMGGHGLFDKHFCFYDDIARIPLIIQAPNLIPESSICDAFASGSIDIAHTILTAAGIHAPESFIGHDLVAMAANGERPRDVAYAQYFGTESGAYSCRMIRDERYKFVYHPVGDIHEFYDLERDPGELVNLIDATNHESELKRLKIQLWDEMHACGDPLANAWTEIELKKQPNLSTRFGL